MFKITEVAQADGSVLVTISFIADGKSVAKLSSSGKMKLGYSGGWKDTPQGNKVNVCYGYRA
jgi:hypothetical protein